MRAVDLFSGPGGWDLGALALGIDPLGVELDDAACATRNAAGLRTVQADVSALDPREFAPCELLIASPPCQAFSMAGSGHGRRALSVYLDAIARMVEGKPPSREELDDACEDPRAHLVLEPLRWALALRPRLVACEQVEPVLPLWEAMASALRGCGYGAWAGVLSAERFGVPQTRRRAILMASLSGRPVEPVASHQRYVPSRVKPAQVESLFAVPEPERIVLPEDRGLVPWVSMAQALGWGMDARPFPVVANHHEQGGVDYSCVGGSSARQRIRDERDAGRWRFRKQFGEDFADPGDERPERPVSEPAPAITTKARSATWKPPTHYDVGQSDEGGNRLRPVDEPAPTITGSIPRVPHTWVPPEVEPTHMNTGRDWKLGGSREDAQRVPVSEPAPAVTTRLGAQAQWVRARDGREDAPRDPEWPENRPATTVAGDPRLAQPGHKNEETRPDCPGRMEGAIRVSVQEAAVLQSFPADYPWQGSRTAVYRQIGDACPPFLARAVLAALVAGDGGL